MAPPTVPRFRPLPRYSAAAGDIGTLPTCTLTAATESCANLEPEASPKGRTIHTPSRCHRCYRCHRQINPP